MYIFNKIKNPKSWKSIVIVSITLSITILIFADIIGPTDKENEIKKDNTLISENTGTLNTESHKKGDNTLPLLSENEEVKPEPKLESRVDDAEVSRSAPTRESRNTLPVNEPEVKTKTQEVPKSVLKNVPENVHKDIPKDVPQNESSPGKSYSAEELDLLARLIHAEAQGEPYEAKVAVGAVVLNRIGVFANSITEVIYQNIDGYYQFTPVENGWINKPAGEESIKAAKEALSGIDPTNGALFYYDNQTTNQWILAKPVSVRFGNMIYAY
jgi:spore germination cell wall hydrolase CwlJ-like protein